MAPRSQSITQVFFSALENIFVLGPRAVLGSFECLWPLGPDNSAMPWEGRSVASKIAMMFPVSSS